VTEEKAFYRPGPDRRRGLSLEWAPHKWRNPPHSAPRPWQNQFVLKGFVLTVLLGLALFAAARANRRRALPPGRFVAEAEKKPEPDQR